MSPSILLRVGRFGLLLASVASLALAAGRNVAPDAVTRATSWNEHDGDVAVLTDGIVPPDASAASFVWASKGVLAFAWEGVVTLDRVRMRIGTVANDYQVRAYVGGHLLDEGATRDPEGEQTARVDDETRVVDGWQEIVLPADTRADNIELRNLGPVVLYEVEILTTEGTAVAPASWGALKAATPTAPAP